MKLVVWFNSPPPGDKAEQAVKRLTEFLNVDPEDVLTLPAWMNVTPFEVTGTKKAKAKTEDDLESMTVEELRAKAHKEGLNLHGASTKAEIVEAIQKGDKS